jgi:cobalt-zinc-cadmium resistance protein CzcA
MIRGLIDFALNNRFIVLIVAILLFTWGIISFHNLPVEAYPDVANNYVTVITQWPGRAAEEVEQQVTVPLEISMAGIPHMQALRSTSLAGLSALNMVFDDSSDDDWNREKVLERLSQVTLPAGLQPQIGTDWSPVGQIYWYTLESTNPAYDSMDLKSIEDWTLEKDFKTVPGVVDVSSFGGQTREYQVRLDPDKLIAYGLTLAQVEQALQNNNVNAGGSFIQEGSQQINVRAVGLYNDVQDIENTLLKTQSGTPIYVRDVATVEEGPKIRLGQIGKTKPRGDGVLMDNADTVEGVLLLQKGDDSDTTLVGIHKEVKELNEHVLPKGVRIVPFLDRSALLAFTTHTVLHNLTEGILLVMVILFLFLGNVRGALIVSLTIPFSLLFASICLGQLHIPANLLSLGALDFGMVVDGTVVMVENIVRRLSHDEGAGATPLQVIRIAAHEVQRPVFYPIGIIIVAYLPIFTLQAVEGRLFRPMAGVVCLVGRLDLCHVRGAGALELPVSAWHLGVGKPAPGAAAALLPQILDLGDSPAGCDCNHRGAGARDRDRPGRERGDRLRVSAASGRRFHLGAGNPRSVYRAGGQRRDHQPRASDPGQLPRGHPGGEPDRAAGRRHRHNRLLQHGVLCRSEAEGPLAAGL